VNKSFKNYYEFKYEKINTCEETKNISTQLKHTFPLHFLHISKDKEAAKLKSEMSQHEMKWNLSEYFPTNH